MRWLRIALVLFPLVLTAAAFAASVKLEPVGPLSDAAVPVAVRDALQPAGNRVSIGDQAYCDIWLAKTVAAGAKNPDPGAAYPQLSPQTFVGVISFAAPVRDFRGHAVKPGIYTMRYETHPNDGNHLGVSPNPDFFLLSPPADDPDPAAQLTFDQLVALSKKASGINHPSVFTLLNADPGPQPKVFQNDDGYYVFASKLKTAAGEVPFALVVKGETQE